MTMHPDALVVRGGTVRDLETLNRKVDEAIKDGDGPVISVFCDVTHDDTGGMTLLQLCAVSDVVHSKVQVSTVSRLRAQGFEPVLEVSNGEPFTHHHVVLAVPVEESNLRAFIDGFDEPIANPTGGKRGRSRYETS